MFSLQPFRFFVTFSRALTFLFRFYHGRLLARCVLVSHFGSFLAPLTPLERSKGSKQCKNKRFFNISKIAPRPSGATSGRPKAPPGAPFGFCARPRGPRDLKIPDRDPWAPRWGPGGGEQGLWSNKMLTYSGQGFQNKKTLPVTATDTFFG